MQLFHPRTRRSEREAVTWLVAELGAKSIAVGSAPESQPSESATLSLARPALALSVASTGRELPAALTSAMSDAPTRSEAAAGPSPSTSANNGGAGGGPADEARAKGFRGTWQRLGRSRFGQNARLAYSWRRCASPDQPEQAWRTADG